MHRDDRWRLAFERRNWAHDKRQAAAPNAGLGSRSCRANHPTAYGFGTKRVIRDLMVRMPGAAWLRNCRLQPHSAHRKIQIDVAPRLQHLRKLIAILLTTVSGDSSAVALKANAYTLPLAACKHPNQGFAQGAG